MSDEDLVDMLGLDFEKSGVALIPVIMNAHITCNSVLYVLKKQAANPSNDEWLVPVLDTLEAMAEALVELHVQSMELPLTILDELVERGKVPAFAAQDMVLELNGELFEEAMTFDTFGDDAGEL